MSRDTGGRGPSRSPGMRIGRGRAQRGGQGCGCTVWRHVRRETSVLGGEGEGEPFSGGRGTNSYAGGGQGGRRGEDELFWFRVEVLGSERCSNSGKEKVTQCMMMK